MRRVQREHTHWLEWNQLHRRSGAESERRSIRVRQRGQMAQHRWNFLTMCNIRPSKCNITAPTSSETRHLPTARLSGTSLSAVQVIGNLVRMLMQLSFPCCLGLGDKEELVQHLPLRPIHPLPTQVQGRQTKSRRGSRYNEERFTTRSFSRLPPPFLCALFFFLGQCFSHVSASLFFMNSPLSCFCLYT